MLNRFDIASLALALGVHATIGYRLFRSRPVPAHKPSVVEVDVHARRVPPPAQPRPTPARPLPRLVEPAVRRMAKAAPPPPSDAPRPHEPMPQKPVFGVQMDSQTTGPSSVTVPVGNTTRIDPRKSASHDGPATPLPPSSGGQSTATPGVLSIKTMPDIDTEACGRTVTYPKEAAALGIEGDVRLRVSLDETGKVLDVKVLAGLGHGLDREAVVALTQRCKFKPAIANDGRAVPFVIDPYVFHFEVPR